MSAATFWILLATISGVGSMMMFLLAWALPPKDRK